ncbi:MAG: hypothetical protein IIC75_00280 [Bacteroidetes bacterium]|nr:hypothetical protein [Bacteroidota bacterium]
MKKPYKKYFKVQDPNYQNVYDNERYEEHLNAFIEHLESKNKELTEAMEFIHKQLLDKKYKNARISLGALIYSQHNQ